MIKSYKPLQKGRMDRYMRQMLDLTSGWEMRAADETTYLSATVPGSVYADLLDHGKMPDPFYRDNEDIAYNLMRQDFVYRKMFTVTPDLLGAKELRLVFEGLDTLVDVSLNDQFILHAENMHRVYQLDIRPFVHEGDNTLTLLFHSPIAAAQASYRQHPVPGSADALDGFPAIRKAHCMYGWDWGPRLPDAGICRPVYLWAVSEPKLTSVLVRQTHKDGRVTLHMQPELDVPCGMTARGLSVRYTLTDPDGKRVARTTDTYLPVPSPRLWWPNGYGEHPLYTLTAELFNDAGVPIDLWEKHIGLRTVSLDRTADDAGESFAFVVNGVPVFAMGADYIPEDSILRRVTPDRTRRLLEDAAYSHFNCIRVWGGGYYPDDFFFDICDELGLLVWQDFMFACAMYELSAQFEENIRAEFACVIRRLRHHPSLALWCGNNENESAVTGRWWGGVSHGLQADYIKMFEYILPQMTSQLDPDRVYWPSSPSSGGCFDGPSDPQRGDSHYWDVWHGNKPFSDYRKHFFRFVSEFGFQSFPDIRTIESFTLPEDRNIFSYVMEKHQRNASANGKILNYISQTYLYPADFEKLVYASQLLQMEAIRCGVEHWRRNRGICMGALYWQLNDCWPVASWSSIDYYGRWKALQYAAKRFFAPILLSCEEDGTHVSRTNINDQQPLSSVHRRAQLNVQNETRFPVDVHVAWSLRTQDAQIVKEGSWDLTVPALDKVWLEPLDFPEASWFDHYLAYELSMDGKRLSEGTALFCAPKHFHFKDPSLTLEQQGDLITVHASAYARMVEIVSDDDILLSDNDFDMNAGSKCVRILRGHPSNLRVRSVYDISRPCPDLSP